MLHFAVRDLEPISLAELSSKALLDRMETKYAMPEAMLDSVLAAIRPHYAVLEVQGQRLNHYRTLYYDTPDFAMYRRHHIGAADRYKVRARQYVESQYAFLEIKHKTKKKPTVKSRIPTAELVTHLADGAAEFIGEHCPYAAAELAPRLWNAYTRITLASKTACERVTLDLDVSFAWEGRQTNLSGLVIAGGQQEALLADLRRRTGLPVARCEIGKLNLIDETADVVVYFEEPRPLGRRFGSGVRYLAAEPVYAPVDNHN